MAKYTTKVDFNWSIPEWAEEILRNFITENSHEVGDQRDSYVTLKSLERKDLAYLVYKILEESKNPHPRDRETADSWHSCDGPHG